MKITLIKTNILDLKVGDAINLEKSIKVGDDISGHMVFGHIDGVSKVIKIDSKTDSNILTIKIKKNISKFLISKCSITLDGVSLTVNNVKDDLMNVYLDGILAYPRIPWILKKLSQVGLQNEILNIISNSVPFCNPDSSTNFKMSWIDQNYETISRTTEKIRSTYNQKFGNLDT